MSGFLLVLFPSNRNLLEKNREVLTWQERASIIGDKKSI